MSKFSFNYSRIELKKDRRDFATNIPREKKKKKKGKLSLSSRMLPSTPFIRNRELNIHRNRFEPRQKTPPLPFSPWELWYVSGNARSSPIQHASNIHEFIRSAELLSRRGWRTLTGGKFPSLHWLFNDTPVSEGYQRETRAPWSKVGSVSNLLFRSGILEGVRRGFLLKDFPHLAF